MAQFKSQKKKRKEINDSTIKVQITGDDTKEEAQTPKMTKVSVLGSSSNP
jgi:hypothetical protein